MKRGRKPEDWSRTTDIYVALIAWKHAPEPEKMSLRELAGKIGISHQLLSYYLKRLSSWSPRSGSPYDRVAVRFEREAERETDPLRRLELKRQARFCNRQATSLMVNSMMKSVAAGFRDDLREKVEAGRSLSKKEIQLAKIYERQGFPVLPAGFTPK